MHIFKNFPEFELILASQSKYKKETLQKLGIPFKAISPDIDESRHFAETPESMVKRLSAEKALKVGLKLINEKAFVVAADQIAVFRNQVIGKPLNHEEAKKQLASFSGSLVRFLTGVSVYNNQNAEIVSAIAEYSVKFRPLSEEEIEHYLLLDEPYDCAGSFKCESSGTLLFENMTGKDPNALVGLPLIALRELFQQLGVNLLTDIKLRH